MAAERLTGIVGTGGDKPAAAGKERGNQHLVGPDEG